jgi:hypothetical protein
MTPTPKEIAEKMVKVDPKFNFCVSIDGPGFGIRLDSARAAFIAVNAIRDVIIRIIEAERERAGKGQP